MIKKQVFCLLFFLATLPLHGFAIHTITYKNPDSLTLLGNGVEFLRDPSKAISINDLINGKVVMDVNKKGVFNFENTSDNIWLRLNLENTTGIPIYIQPGNPELDHITCYGVINDSLVWSVTSGNLHVYSSRFLKSNKICLPLGADKTTTIYIKVETGSSFYLPLYVGSIQALSGINHQDDLFNGAVIGIMLVMLFYNFFLFLAVRDKLYLQYCLYLFFSTFLILYLEGLTFDLIWPNNVSYNDSHLANIIVAATTASAIWFSSSFLRIKTNAPRLKWVNLFLIVVLLISITAELVGNRLLANQLVQAGSGLTSVYLFITGIILFFQGLKEAKFYILSWGVLVTMALIYILTLNGVVAINFFTMNSFELGSMLECVLLSFALADRINTFRREKYHAQKQAILEAQKNERLIRDQNAQLEIEVEKRTRQLQSEMQKSEDLLLNILPQEVAEELKNKGASEAKLYNHVSVLFTDFVNFTGAGEHLSPKDLVNEIHHCFKAFDDITEKLGLEKIKTIGDAYMAVCGMPAEDNLHALKSTQAAMEILRFVKDYKSNGGVFEIRIGIHSGPVVAGIVGVKKYAYDIWGDTVNTASRMESCSETGKINISGATYELIKEKIHCTYRGKIEAKNKGFIDMYFVDEDSHPSFLE